MRRRKELKLRKDPPSPSGRGREARARQGEASRKCEGLKIRIELRPSPGAPACWLSRRPLPAGERLLLLLFVFALQGCRDNRDSQQQPPAPHHPAIVSPSAPAATARLMDGMGKVDFPITTSSKDAQAFFNQGVAQLYGFWFVEAERSFLEAARLDPNAAMAYWGIAMATPGTFLPAYQLALTPNPGLPGLSPNSPESRARAAIVKAAITEVAVELAHAIVRDGEGATKFITIGVEGGRDEAECRRVAFAIAHSPLVKTAFFASDPNLGRVVSAIGNARIADLDPARVSFWLNDLHVVARGARAATYREEDGQRIMKEAEITVRVDLGRGSARATVWTCDLSHDYVSVNADYRS